MSACTIQEVQLPDGVSSFDIKCLNANGVLAGISSLSTSGGATSQSMMRSMAQSASSSSSSQSPWMGPPVQLAVDANRDGKIVLANDQNNPANVDSSGKPLPADTTSSDKPYRFWVNDDDDHGSDGTENVPMVRSDYMSSVISSKRDLEDFARLWVYIGAMQDAINSGSIQIGLKWKTVTSGTPTIKIFPAADTSGSDGYLKDDNAATAQVTGTYGSEIKDKNSKEQVDTGGTFILPKGVWNGLSSSNPTQHFLFEGAGEGKGQLELVFLDGSGNQIGEGGSLWLDIKNIKKMYQRGISTPFDPNGLPKPFDDPWNTYNDSGISWTDDSSGNSFSKPWDEEKKLVVFVHGSNETKPYSTANAETLFKRLWWQGYKGRFALFRWDTLVGPLDGWLPAQYNLNEWRAWKFGKGLKAFVENVPDTSNYTKNICGHSLGNTVIASALQKGMQVTNCVFMQGAIPAGCFDSSGGASDSNSINGYQKFWDAENSNRTPDNASDKGYRGLLAGISGNFVNFYNESDYALATGPLGAWEWNQTDYKPDASKPGWWYFYDSSLDPGYQIKMYSMNGNYRRFITDSHESMSFVARARSKALGAKAGVGGVIGTNVNVGEGSGSVGNFSYERSDHSGEFTRKGQILQSYYKELIKRLGVATPE